MRRDATSTLSEWSHRRFRIVEMMTFLALLDRTDRLRLTPLLLHRLPGPSPRAPTGTGVSRGQNHSGTTLDCVLKPLRSSAGKAAKQPPCKPQVRLMPTRTTETRRPDPTRLFWVLVRCRDSDGRVASLILSRNLTALGRGSVPSNHRQSAVQIVHPVLDAAASAVVERPRGPPGRPRDGGGDAGRRAEPRMAVRRSPGRCGGSRPPPRGASGQKRLG